MSSFLNEWRKITSEMDWTRWWVDESHRLPIRYDVEELIKDNKP